MILVGGKKAHKYKYKCEHMYTVLLISNYHVPIGYNKIQ